MNTDRLIEVELVDKDGQTEKEKMFYRSVYSTDRSTTEYLTKGNMD